MIHIYFASIVIKKKLIVWIATKERDLAFLNKLIHTNFEFWKPSIKL